MECDMKMLSPLSILFLIITLRVHATPSFRMDSKGIKGNYTVEYNSGQIAVSGQFKNGNRIGVWKAYHENGNLLYIRNFKNGWEDGKCTYWDSNGQKIIEGHYTKGWKTGHWKCYYPDGSTKAEGLCERNTFHKEWLFYENQDTLRHTYNLGTAQVLTQRMSLEDPDSVSILLTKSFFTISMNVNGRERFIWRFNSSSDYKLELDQNENGLPHGMYSFSTFHDREPSHAYDRFSGEWSDISFDNGIKKGIQQSYFYEVSGYTPKMIRLNNTLYRKQIKGKLEISDRVGVFYKMTNKRLIKGQKLFKTTSNIGFIDVAINSGTNTNGHFEGTCYSQKTGNQPIYINEKKDSIPFIDHCYHLDVAEEKYHAFDSLCLINSRDIYTRYDTNENIILKEWDTTTLQRHRGIAQMLYRSGNTSFNVKEMNLWSGQILDTYTVVIDPAYLYPVFSYPDHTSGYTAFTHAMNEWGPYSVPMNTLAHGPWITHYGAFSYEKYFDYGFLTSINLIKKP